MLNIHFYEWCVLVFVVHEKKAIKMSADTTKSLSYTIALNLTAEI